MSGAGGNYEGEKGKSDRVGGRDEGREGERGEGVAVYQNRRQNGGIQHRMRPPFPLI